MSPTAHGVGQGHADRMDASSDHLLLSIPSTNENNKNGKMKES